MNPFRKSFNRPRVDYGSTTVNDMVVMQTKEVKTKDCSEPTTVIEVKTVNAKDFAKTVKLPDDKDYQLRDMLAAGQLPDAVPVSGMLDSQDPTDLRNQGVGDAIFDKLASQVKSSEPAPAAEPAPSNESSNAE